MFYFNLKKLILYFLSSYAINWAKLPVKAYTLNPENPQNALSSTIFFNIGLIKEILIEHKISFAITNLFQKHYNKSNWPQTFKRQLLHLEMFDQAIFSAPQNEIIMWAVGKIVLCSVSQGSSLSLFSERGLCVAAFCTAVMIHIRLVNNWSARTSAGFCKYPVAAELSSL